MELLGWRLPAGPLRASAAGTKFAVFVTIVAVASLLRAPLSLGSLYPLKSSALFAISMAVAIGFLGRGHPFERFGPANQITTARAALVALAAGLIGEAATPTVAAAAVIATLAVTMLDAADGWFARTTRMASAFGARFDMEVDALLILVLSILAWRLGKAGPWILLAGLMRYGFIAAGWLFASMRTPLGPSRRRQSICVVSVLGLAAVMLPFIAPPLSALVGVATLAVLGYSFLVDALSLWRIRCGEMPVLPGFCANRLSEIVQSEP
jgi:phosphatidylglycerophosphate synthase